VSRRAQATAAAPASSRRWPWPAVVVWLLAWGVGWASLLLATTVGVAGSVWGGDSRWRRVLIALGFPVSWAVAVGVLDVPAWVWLLPLLLLALLYPPSSWKDAPWFPTPLEAFEGLREQVPLPLAGHVLDAGCGLGHGLRALDRAYRDTYLHGVERSWPLVWWCRLTCRIAEVHQGDMWAEDWSRYDMVYLFQRPESMARAWSKARQELRPGAWLASLEFEVPGQPATAQWDCPDGRPLWLYQKPQLSPAESCPD